MATTYVEITKAEHDHGGLGWEFGTCLWSPTRNQSGADRYSIMREPKVNDEVVHIYNTTIGGTRDTYIIGRSLIRVSCAETIESPPNPGSWIGKSPYYRIELSGYADFAAPLPVRTFLSEYGDEIRNDLILSKPRFYPFNTYGDRIVTVQGIYLARCTPVLRHLFDQALSIQAAPQDPNEPDLHATYREARRLARERYFFARNSGLARDAKRHRGYRCQVCGFDFFATYGEIGKDYIEAHHLDPLSERPESDWSDELSTSIDRVAVLCANCHRMIHRRQPAYSLDDLRFAYLAAAASL